MSAFTGEHMGVIDQIYAAALDPRLWGATLTEIARLTHSCSSLLMAYSPNARLRSLVGSSNLSPAQTLRYQTELAERDDLNQFVIEAPVGSLIDSVRVLGAVGTRRSSVYDDYYRPLGIAHYSGVVLSKWAGGWIAASVNRSASEGPHSESAAAHFMALAPHLMNAVRVRRAIERSDSLARFSLNALDALGHAAVVFDHGGNVIHMNRGAELFLASEPSLFVEGDRLKALGSPQAERLCKEILQACAGLSSLTRAVTVKLTRGSSRPPACAVVCSPAAVLREHIRFEPVASAAVLLIYDPTTSSSGIDTALVRMYELTPAEARVAAAAVFCSGIGAIAARLSVGRETVRTHLKRIFQKIGVASQAELVRVVLTEIHMVTARDAIEQRPFALAHP